MTGSWLPPEASGKLGGDAAHLCGPASWELARGEEALSLCFAWEIRGLSFSLCSTPQSCTIAHQHWSGVVLNFVGFYPYLLFICIQLPRIAFRFPLILPMINNRLYKYWKWKVNWFFIFEFYPWTPRSSIASSQTIQKHSLCLNGY